ncbi:uncharacterized protein LOC119985434 [Tripterygium wilfordii]|nr:uncharacterized protein LOC119985434 [Tripterygium wilfordii]
MIRQSRTDIALLLQNGQLQQALPRVEQLYKEQCRFSAYEQIDLFCQCLTTNVPDVIQQSDQHCLPSEIHVAVSSLIFAASRCGELPELQMLRCFFRKYYGCRIDKDNVQLLPGNLVHYEIKENLCISSVPEDEKLRLISDIANKYTLHLGYQEHHEVSFKAEQKAEVMDMDMQDICSDNSDEGSTQTMNLRTPENIGSHNMDKRCSNRKNVPPKIRSRRLSTGDALAYNQSSMSAIDRRSFDRSIRKLKEERGNSPGHVHPKLPNYEDVVSELTDIKQEYKRGQSYSKHSFF